LAVVILLSSVYVLSPIQFSSFPSILLLSTLFRLSLNIASTRLILLNGSQGPSAAGDVIRAFGQFVVGGNYAVGIVIFLVLIVIQYVVINHGAVRISEVTARFTLDALPGKQLAIDADLNAGIIDQQEARERRAEIGREAEFYGAMDGAIRFTQRDAMARNGERFFGVGVRREQALATMLLDQRAHAARVEAVGALLREAREIERCGLERARRRSVTAAFCTVTARAELLVVRLRETRIVIAGYARVCSRGKAEQQKDRGGSHRSPLSTEDAGRTENVTALHLFIRPPKG